MNPALERCKLIHETLKTHCRHYGDLSSTSTGTEQEVIVNTLLSVMFPPVYRLDQGEIVDRHGCKTDQIDVVVEYPFVPSLPLMPGTPRLYFAGGVALVIEVKSTLNTAWDRVLAKAEKVRKIDRELGEICGVGGHPSVRPENIPFFVIGFKGWKKQNTLWEKLKATDLVDCAFVVNEEVCQCRPNLAEGAVATGMGDSLLAFLANIQLILSAYPLAHPDITDFAR